MIKQKVLPLLSAQIAVHLFFTTEYVRNAAITVGSRLLRKQLRNNPGVRIIPRQINQLFNLNLTNEDRVRCFGR